MRISSASILETLIANGDFGLEWEAKPSSPESIRLISMGKLLTDKSKLSGMPKPARILGRALLRLLPLDFGFKDGAVPTIIHMTIKPQEILDEEEANKNPRDRESDQRSPGCRCIIM